jgi:hypothetical protein
MQDTQGFVYVIANAAMPGIVKIGRTSRNPIDRAAELYGTGVPLPFRIEFVLYSENSMAMEERAHKRFARHRLNAGREFFEVSTADVIEWMVNSAIGEHDLTCIYCEKELRQESIDYACNETGCHPFEATDLLRYVDADEIRMAYDRMCRDRLQQKEEPAQCIE